MYRAKHSLMEDAGGFKQGARLDVGLPLQCHRFQPLRIRSVALAI